jgi:uncharacterized protein (DUF1501 family)
MSTEHSGHPVGHLVGDGEESRCDCPPRTVGRRGFLGGAAGLAALGMVSGLGTRGNMSVAFADGASDYNGNTLVVVSLRGGFDGLSAVMPIADPYYAGTGGKQAIRPTVGLTQAQVFQLDSTFGMHPALAPLQALWTSKQLAFVHNVGQEDPTMSHFDATALMEQAEPNQADHNGWIERLATLSGPVGGDAFAEVSLGPATAPASTYGAFPTTAMQSLSSFKLNGTDGTNDFASWSKALKALQAGASTYVKTPTLNALTALSAVSDMSSSSPQNGANYPNNTDLAKSLSDLAKLIRAGGVRVAAVDSNGTNYQGWDMHVGMGGGTNQGGWIWSNLTTLGQSLAAFAQDLGPAMANVTLVVLSEFGRRAYENDSGGVDHGHGNLVIVLGGGVNGGTQVLGKWEGLSPSQLDANGNLRGSNDYRWILAEIASKRLGFTTSELKAVFPFSGKVNPLDTSKWVGVAT